MSYPNVEGPMHDLEGEAVEGGAVTPAEVARARGVLLDRASWLGLAWIDTELVGGHVSDRARRRHVEQQQRENAARAAEAHELESIAALSDAELAWLLSVGWTPEGHR